MALDKNLFTNWVEGQQFRARDYVYERNLIIDYINTITNLRITELATSVFDERYYTQDQVDVVVAGLQDKIDDRVKYTDLTSSLIVYPTTQLVNLGGADYGVLVSSLDDSRYDSTATLYPSVPFVVDNQNMEVASLVTDPGLIIGNPGVFNVVTVGKIKKIAGGSGQGASFYYRIFKMNAAGTIIEPAITTSDPTATVLNTVLGEFTANALFNNGTFVATDRLLIKYYASNIGGGSPTFQFEFGGTSPVRTLLPVPLSVVTTTGPSTAVGAWSILTEYPNDAEHVTTAKLVAGYPEPIDYSYITFTGFGFLGETIQISEYISAVRVADGAIGYNPFPFDAPWQEYTDSVSTLPGSYILINRPDIPNLTTLFTMFGYDIPDTYTAYVGSIRGSYFHIDQNTYYGFPYGYGYGVIVTFNG